MGYDTGVDPGQVLGVSSLRPTFMIGNARAQTSVNAGRKKVFMVAVLGICDLDKQSEFDIKAALTGLGWVMRKDTDGDVRDQNLGPEDKG